MQVQSNERPADKVVFYKDTTRNFVVFNDLDSVEEIETEDGTAYVYDSYQMNTSASEELIISKADELFEKAKQFEYEKLAEKVREKRNKLLEESDKFMCLDRLSLDTSSALKFLSSLKTIFSNEYAEYRQALRDITDQEGFPYDVTFPEKPKGEQ